MSKECLKTLGVVAQSSECPGACGIIQIVLEKTKQKGNGSRGNMEKIAVQISNQYCPSGVEIVLPKRSRAQVW